MSGRLAAALLSALSLAGAAGATGEPSAAPPELAPATADASSLADAMAEVAPRLDESRPGVAAYLNDVTSAALTALAGLVERLGPSFGRWLGPLARVLAGALLVAAGASFLVALLRRRRWRTPVGDDLPPASSPLEAEPTAVDAGRRAEEVEARLGRGDPLGALAALWWWLAGRLAGGAAEPSWTSRELLEASGRRDLRGAVRRLDGLRYGAAPPQVPAVRRLFAELRAAVATGDPE